MKNSRKSSRAVSANFRCQAALAALATMISVPTLHAANGAWNVDANGNWSTTTNWTPAAVPGTAAGDVVDLLFNITAARTVTIDTTSRTVGDLNIGDPTATLFGYTLASSAGTVVLNLDGTGAADATVDFRTGVANTISAPLTLVDNAIFRSNVAFVQTLSGVISGTGKTVTFNNDTDGTVNAAAALNGQFFVTGANTYTGGTTISDVRVQIQTSNLALGAAGSAVNILNGGQFYNSSGLQTINYAFSIAGNGWVETAAGQPFGALRLESGAIVTGTVAMTADSAIGSNSGIGTISGVVSGGFNLSKVGSGGTVALSGVNTYTGTTTVLDGALQVRNNAALGNSASTVVLQNSGAPTATDINRLELSGGITLSRNILMENIGNANARTYLSTASTVNANSNTYSGTITLKGAAGGHQFEAASALMIVSGSVVQDGTAPAPALAIRGGSTGTLTGTINIGTAFISKTDSGTWIINSNTNTWGQTNAQDGQLQLGINNALPTTTLLEIGQGSGTSGRFELNGFNQSLTGLRTNTGSSGTAHIIRNSNLATPSTLTVTTAATETLKNVQIFGTPAGLGNLTIVREGTGRTQLDGGLHSANWTVNAGTLAFTDSTAGNVRTITGTIAGSATATVDKASVSVVNLAGPLNNLGTTTVTAGSLTTSTGTSNAVTVANGATLGAGLNSGVFNASTVTFGTSAGSTFAPYLGSATIAPLNVTSLTTSGTTVSVVPQGISFTPGNYAIIDYAGSIGGNDFGGFALGIGLYPHMTASLANNTIDTRVELTITAVDSLIWTGNASGVWDVNNASNFALASATSTPATFYVNDSVVFGDTSDVPGAATPVSNRTLTGGTIPIGNLTFTNTGANDYSVANPLTGVGGITKSGNGVLTLTGASNYSGTTTVNAGTFNLTGGSLTGSNITVAAGATMTATGAINNAFGGSAVTITSSGTTTLAPTVASTFTGAVAVNGGTLTANYTTAAPIPAANAISVAGGATLRLRHDGGVFGLANPISGAGTVVVDPGAVTAGARDITAVTWNTAGFTGTLRLAPTTGTMRIAVDNPTDLGSGIVEVAAGGQIFVNTANLTFPNNITISGTGYSEAAGTLGAIRASNPSTFTGAITLSGPAKIGALGGTAVITNSISGNVLTFGGSINNASSETLAITGNATGLTGLVVNDGSATSNAATITVNVGNGTASGTLGAVPVSLLADGFKNSVIRFDRADGYTLGAAITSTSAAANHVRTFVDLDSTGTGVSDGGQTITLGSAAPNSGGTIRVGQGRANALATLTGTSTSEKIAVSAALSGATLNIGTGANISTNFFTIGEAANATGGVVNQTDGIVNVVGQVRVGHFGTLTGTYNMNGGALTLTGASPSLTPSTLNAGAANATGDNNINASATFPLIVGGGIYLGIDGTGIMNHTGGTVTTNWIVLDNRGDTAAGTNMGGVDTYSLSGAGSVLNLRSTYGLIARNTSTAVNFGGGTVRVDNTGTGTGTGANITIPLDATIDTAGTTNLDTNGAGNGLTLTRDVRGSGTLNLTGGGTVNASTAGNQVISANLTGSTNLRKQGAGATTLSGSGSGYTGNVTVTAGRLNVPANLAAGIITVADGAALGGEPTTANVNLGSAAGSTLFFNPATAGALTATNLTLAGTTTIDLSAAPTGAGPYTVLNYTGVTGALTFALANAAAYRPGTLIDTTVAGTVTLTTVTKDLTYTAAGGTTWNVATTSNWNDPSPAPDMFFAGDTVTFPELGATQAVTVTSGVSPWKTTVNAATTAYTLTSTTNGIAGPGNLEKSNGGSLTLVGPNTYAGQTIVGGGTVVISAANSLGNASATNTIGINGGGRLSITAGLDLGATRAIALGTGGGSISVNNAAAQTVTVSGNLTGSGSDNLSVHTAAAGAGTFILTGNNSGFTGRISVDAPAAVAGGLTALRIGTQVAAPAGGSITLNYPAAGATGNATTLDLPGITLPAALTLNMTSFVTAGNISQRTQVTSSGATTINGPITLAGTSIVQFTTAAGAVNTYNGAIGETTPGSFVETGLLVSPFSNVLFFRGTTTSTHIINNQINLPSAGSTIAVTDGATVIVNSTGNVARSSNALFGTIRLGINDALPTAGRLVIGQTPGDQACTVDLNGFNQTVTGLEWQAPTGNLLTKGISNTHPTATSTFTVNQATAPVSLFNGTISGRVNLVKDGAATHTLQAAASTFTGNVTVSNGTLVAPTIGAANGANGTLGAANVAGRTVTVNGLGILSFTSNNIFGNGVGNNNLPSVILSGGGTLTSSRYNALGNITLIGGTLTQSATDAGNYEGYQFRGNITVPGGGGVASTISTGNGKANHLGPNTIFSVGDATVDANTDLTVSTILRNQSGDFALAVGSLTKAGNGTMALTASNTYTGTTQIDAGTLQVNPIAANGIAQPLGTAISAILIGTATSTGTLEYTGAPAADLQRDITFNPVGGGIIKNSGGGTLTLSGALNKNGSTATLTGGTFVASGLITGVLPNSDLVVDGANVTITNPNNSYTGPTRAINGGTVTPTSNGALGAAAGGIQIKDASTLKAGGNLTTNARTVTLGTGGGKIDTNGNTVTLDVGSTVTGTTLTKLGAGKLVLAGTQTYATLDTEAGRTDIASALGTGTSSIIANAETNISVSQTLASLTIGEGAVVSLGAPLPPAPGGAGEVAGFVADIGGGDLAGAPIQGVPEPGSATLLFGGILTLLGLRRRR